MLTAVILIFLSLACIVQCGMVDAPVGCTGWPIMKVPLCSGKGFCQLIQNNTIITQPNIPNSRCICDAGWTGYNDFVNMNTHDCGQNLLFIYILWVFIILSSLIQMFIIYKKIFDSYIAFKELIKEENDMTRAKTTMAERTDNKEYREGDEISFQMWLTFLKWPVVTASLFGILNALPIFIAGIMRILNYKLVIGESVVITFLFIVSSHFFFISERVISISWLDCRGKLLRFTEEDEHAAKRTIKRLKFSVKLASLFDLLRIIFLLCILGIPKQANLFTLLYNMGMIGTVITTGAAIIKAGRGLTAIISNGLELLGGSAREERERTLTNIKNTTKIHTHAMFSSTILFVLSGWWPFLRAHQTYFLFQGITVSILMSSHLIAMGPSQLSNKTHLSRSRSRKQTTGGSSGTRPKPKSVQKQNDMEEDEKKEENAVMVELVEPASDETSRSQPHEERGRTPEEGGNRLEIDEATLMDDNSSSHHRTPDSMRCDSPNSSHELVSSTISIPPLSLKPFSIPEQTDSI